MNQHAIQTAAERFRTAGHAFVRRTPLWKVPGAVFGLDLPELWLKLEHLQSGGSFKARGMYNRLLANPIPAAGVIVASGGNAGIATAAAARALGVRCEVSTQFAECECKETATMVFRIFQELLTNVAKHSKASRVRVFLKQMGGIIYLSVSDNGCGFDLKPAKRKAGFGLLGMRERAESVRGRLQIESVPGVGTTVTLCVPVSNETRNGG